MKALLISLLVVVSTQTKANDLFATTEIHWEKSAPTFASLQIESSSRNLTLVNPLLSRVESAQVSFNSKSLTLTFVRSMPPCAPNMACIEVMPAPVQVNLHVYKTERTQCSVKYFAATPANVRSLVYEQVVLEDLSLSKCFTTMDLPRRAGFITYKVTGVSSLSKRQETAIINLSTQEFIRATKLS